MELSNAQPAQVGSRPVEGAAMTIASARRYPGGAALLASLVAALASPSR